MYSKSVSRCALFSCTLLIALFANSCRRSAPLPETLPAHYIQYEITYQEQMAGDIPTRILPAQMDSWYTSQHVLTKIEGFFNQFSLIQMSDLKSKRVTTMLNFFGNKVYSISEKDHLPAGVRSYEELELKNTGEFSDIGGLHSERVEVTTESEEFDIYFTRDFSVRRPNLSTPYRSVHHPLSAFRIELSYLNMNLICTTYEQRNVESDIFIIPDDYRPVSPPVMEEIINSLFTKE
jgi:hypothetical protein